MITIDKEQLKQIRYIKSEISIIESQIANLEPSIVNDKVTGSSPFFPYTAMSFHIEGMDLEDYNRRIKRLRNKLIKRKNELLELNCEANKFIENINDSLVRQILTLRYINGMSWDLVANEIGTGTTPESVRKVAERFLK